MKYWHMPCALEGEIVLASLQRNELDSARESARERQSVEPVRVMLKRADARDVMKIMFNVSMFACIAMRVKVGVRRLEDGVSIGVWREVKAMQLGAHPNVVQVHVLECKYKQNKINIHIEINNSMHI